MVNRKIYTLLIGCFWVFIQDVFAQEQKIADSLALVYQKKAIPDSVKLILLRDLSFNETKDLKKGLQYAEELIKLSEKIRNDNYLRAGYFLKGTKERLLGNLNEALSAYIKSAELARILHNVDGEGEADCAIGDIYTTAKNYPNAMLYYQKAIRNLRQPMADSTSLASALSNAGEVYFRIGRNDSALLYFTEAKTIFDKLGYLSGRGYSLGNIGMVYASIGNNDLAESNMNEAIRILEEQQDYYPICVYLTAMSDVYLSKGDKQTAISYTLKSLQLAKQYGLKEQIGDASLKLSELYKEIKPVEALTYYKSHIAYRDSLNNLKTVQEMADLRTDFEVSKKQVEVNLLNQQKQSQKKLTLSLGIILGLAIIILGILIRNNQHKQKAYALLNLQKQETELQKAKAEETLSELQLTQKQLIQAAKMASLGELTAGIAHEIQNPLNFITNFSEVSVELLDELKTGVISHLTGADKMDADEIAGELTGNLKKINEHGKRADAIVKGMLQHSRMGTGKKEPTSINAIADEFLRLSYHGLRAKNKDFNARFTTNFDEGIGKLDVIPQDIGRVLLNLFNNGFYSAYKKKKESRVDLEPLVSVTTKRVGQVVEITVTDNGEGIPKQVLEKIFQPFFTTKPSGEGTGLGLSLCYDIITAHGGELKVETEEGSFARFIIQLPAGRQPART